MLANGKRDNTIQHTDLCRRATLRLAINLQCKSGAMKNNENDLSYYGLSFFGDWKARDDGRAVHDIAVSFERAPPPCRYETTPMASKPQTEQDEIPPFDIQEIPEVMRQMLMPTAAKLLQRWFEGALNFSPTERDEANLINQEGKPYPPSMIDTTSIKISWVLKYPRAREVFERLKSPAVLTSPAANDRLRKILQPLRAPDRKLRCNDLCGGDIAELHKRFQFQFQSVDGSFKEKFKEYIRFNYEGSGSPDDLSGALGSFNFYAALNRVGFSWDASKAHIFSILVYVKDNFTFTDKEGEISQYLGHWSRKGMILVPYNMALSAANIKALPPMGTTWSVHATAVGRSDIRGNIYYPVWNPSYREWQRKHHQGGDFIIYSDSIEISFDGPIEVVL
jgi:hypothetical protein